MSIRHTVGGAQKLVTSYSRSTSRSRPASNFAYESTTTVDSAIHGGVLGAFMELTALVQLSLKEGQARQPRVIDVTIEYLRSGRSLTTFARADIKKVGRRIANVHVEAWQSERAQPIAALRGHFLVTPTS